ncbi:MAG: EF-hand domain-containing protein [Catenulispora sp.]
MEISSFLDRKLDRRFATYDVDGDGYTDRSDFEKAAAAMVAEFGLEPEDAAAARLTGLCLELWEVLAAAADADIDSRISRTEYKNAFAAGLLETEDSFEAGYLPFLDAIMDIADTDGDGRLSPAEHSRWIASLMNVPPGDAVAIARRLDADGDGYIDRQEILDAIHAYYFDEDPESAGSWLLGPLGNDG